MAERDHVPDMHALYLHLLKNHLENTNQILLLSYSLVEGINTFKPMRNKIEKNTR